MKYPIRILHVIGELEIGGSQSLVLNIYKLIDKSKIQFDFIIDNPKSRKLQNIVEDLGGKVYYLPKFNGKNIREVKSQWKNFFSLHKDYKILHSHIRSYASIYIPIAKEAGLKVIIHSHATSEGKGLSAIAKRVLEYPLRYQADYFFACSEKAAIWLFGKKIAKSNKYYLLKNGIVVNDFEFKLSSRERIRNQYRINDKFVIGHIGRFVEAKNHKFMIKTFNMLIKSNDNFRLLLVGDGPYKKDIEKLVREYRLDDYVIFVGESIKPETFYSAMDLFLFPSKFEGLGISLIEAQCNGLPCIVSDRIPSESILTTNVQILNIEESKETFKLWVDSINKNFPMKARQSNLKIIRNHGYDLNQTSIDLQEFYLNFIN